MLTYFKELIPTYLLIKSDLTDRLKNKDAVQKGIQY